MKKHTYGIWCGHGILLLDYCSYARAKKYYDDRNGLDPKRGEQLQIVRQTELECGGYIYRIKAQCGWVTISEYFNY